MFQKAETLWVQILILVKSFNTIDSSPQALLYVPLKNVFNKLYEEGKFLIIDIILDNCDDFFSAEDRCFL